MKKTLRTIAYLLFIIAPVVLYGLVVVAYVTLAYMIVRGSFALDPLSTIMTAPLAIIGLILLVCVVIPGSFDHIKSFYYHTSIKIFQWVNDNESQDSV